jgi:hypothetical protein
MENPYICTEHENTRDSSPLSPARYTCKLCKKRTVNGYSNPHHVSNPFCYLYLAPMICIKCAIETKQCMWCSRSDVE